MKMMTIKIVSWLVGEEAVNHNLPLLLCNLFYFLSKISIDLKIT